MSNQSLPELIRIHEDALRAAQDEHARLVYELTLSPGDEALTKQRADITAEITSVSARLDTLRTAFAGESIAAKRKRIDAEEEAIGQAQRVIDETDKPLVALDRKLFDAASTMCSLLHEREKISAARKRSAKTIDRHSVANEDRYCFNHGVHLETNAGSDTYVAAVLLDLLVDAGFGRTGVQFPTHLLEIRRAHIDLTIEQATTKGIEKFRDLVKLKLSRRPANVAARAEREVSPDHRAQRTRKRMEDLAVGTQKQREQPK